MTMSFFNRRIHPPQDLSSLAKHTVTSSNSYQPCQHLQHRVLLPQMVVSQAGRFLRRPSPIFLKLLQLALCPNLSPARRRVDFTQTKTSFSFIERPFNTANPSQPPLNPRPLLPTPVYYSDTIVPLQSLPRLNNVNEIIHAHD